MNLIDTIFVFIPAQTSTFDVTNSSAPITSSNSTLAEGKVFNLLHNYNIVQYFYQFHIVPSLGQAVKV